MSEIMDDKEVGRWQQAIYERCCKAVEGLRETRTIDGAGCDSGDPLDLTLTEIGQAFCGLRDEIDLLTRERDEARGKIVDIMATANRIDAVLVKNQNEIDRLERAVVELDEVRGHHEQASDEVFRRGEEIQRLDAEVKRLCEALEKAASTLEDTATDLRLLSRIDNC